MGNANENNLIAISHYDFLKYGCPHCGCDASYTGNMYGHGTFPQTCRECRKEFIVLAEDVKKSAFGFSTGEKDENNETIFYYPELQEHPRKGTPWHPWVQPDPRPENGGEFWASRGIGYDLSGFVKSKAAGERLLEMVKEVLGKEKPASWLDWREYEPEWIQFKFQESEFDLNKLHDMATNNNGVLTKEILQECKLNWP